MMLDKNNTITLSSFWGEKIPILNNYGLITAACLTLAFALLYINTENQQAKQYETINLRKDALVFLTGLVAPIVLVGFAYMFFNANIYSKKVLFGSRSVQQYINEFDETRYTENSHIYTFPTHIVYEDNICLQGGEDKNEVRYLFPNGGASFGPYIKLYPGTYQITLHGQNLEQASYDCIYSLNGEIHEIPIELISSNEQIITYQITITELTQNIETRVFDWSEEPLLLYDISIQEI
ncbi:MAG: hypothetical protein IJ757_01855 [Clostridiales bacterium]|nr:hypothetical protein [Clostridiales bacterium]